MLVSGRVSRPFWWLASLEDIQQFILHQSTAYRPYRTPVCLYKWIQSSQYVSRYFPKWWHPKMDSFQLFVFSCGNHPSEVVNAPYRSFEGSRDMVTSTPASSIQPGTGWKKNVWTLYHIQKNSGGFIPQIAIAIGALTSNRGEGDEPLWRIGRGTRVQWTCCHCRVPLQGAIVVC